MHYILIAKGEGSDPARVTIHETEAERDRATLAAMYGRPEAADPVCCAKELAELRENGVLNFEGDPGLEWVNASEVEHPGNTKLRDALAPLASCANEYFAEAPQGAHLDTVFTLAEARKAAAAMGWPTHMPRV